MLFLDSPRAHNKSPSSHKLITILAVAALFAAAARLAVSSVWGTPYVCTLVTRPLRAGSDVTVTTLGPGCDLLPPSWTVPAIAIGLFGLAWAGMKRAQRSS